MNDPAETSPEPFEEMPVLRRKIPKAGRLSAINPGPASSAARNWKPLPLHKTASCRKYVALLTVVILLSAAGMSAAAAASGRSPAPDGQPPSAMAGTTAPKSPLPLTEAEKSWLARHRTIRVAFDGYFPPYSVLNDAGQVEGLAVDHFRLLAERAGLSIEISPERVWNRLYEAAKRREIDVVATMGKQPEREQWFVFTKPYIFKSMAIMTRLDAKAISGPEELAGKRVAVVKSYQYVKPLLEKYPAIEPYPVDTMLDGLNAVAIGKADAAITFVGAGHYLKTRYQIANLKFAALYDRDRFTDSIAVRKEWPELASILDKALDAVSAAELRALQEKWLPEEVIGGGAVLLTEAEKAWIRNHPVIRIGVNPEFAPYAYRTEEGTFSGIAVDYIKLLNKKLGLNMQAVPGLTWREVVEKAKTREIDLIPGIAVTEERKAFLRFSEPYINFYRVIVTRKEAPFVNGLEDLRGLRVAVQAATVHEAYLKKHPGIQPVSYPTLQEALPAVAAGKADALVHNLASTTHWIAKLNLTDLKVAAAISEGSGTLHIAVRKDWPELVSIIDKGLAAIPPDERAEIQRRWVGIDYEPGFPWRLVYRFLAVLAGLILLAAAGFTTWNRTLKRRVRQKTAELERELQQRRRIEDALRESEERYRQLFSHAPAGIYEVDFARGKFTQVNSLMCEYTGYSQEELLGMTPLDILTEESRRHFLERLEKIGRGESVSANPEFQITNRDGSSRWVQLNVHFIQKDGMVTGASVVAHDITERKRSEEQLRQTLESLRKAVHTTIQVMVSAVETRDPYTAGHQIRSADLARAIATEMGLSQQIIEGLRMAGSIHDIGKLSIPAEILSKPTRLSEIEFSLIREHARKGYEMLKDVESPWPLAEMVYQHHERMDGSGYPRRLKGEEILPEARILNVADVVEAMASHRPYRPGLGLDAALREIEQNSGTLYDRTVVDACLRLFREKGFRLAEA